MSLLINWDAIAFESLRYLTQGDLRGENQAELSGKYLVLIKCLEEHNLTQFLYLLLASLEQLLEVRKEINDVKLVDLLILEKWVKDMIVEAEGNQAVQLRWLEEEDRKYMEEMERENERH